MKWSVVVAATAVGTLGWIVVWAYRTMDPPTPRWSEGKGDASPD